MTILTPCFWIHYFTHSRNFDTNRSTSRPLATMTAWKCLGELITLKNVKFCRSFLIFSQHTNRFEKSDIQRLCTALRIPEKYKCSQGTSATGMEALMIMLRRLTYPNRWCDLSPLFGRGESQLSLIFNTVSLVISFSTS